MVARKSARWLAPPAPPREDPAALAAACSRPRTRRSVIEPCAARSSIFSPNPGRRGGRRWTKWCRTFIGVMARTPVAERNRPEPGRRDQLAADASTPWAGENLPLIGLRNRRWGERNPAAATGRRRLHAVHLPPVTLLTYHRGAGTNRSSWTDRIPLRNRAGDRSNRT